MQDLVIIIIPIIWSFNWGHGNNYFSWYHHPNSVENCQVRPHYYWGLRYSLLLESQHGNYKSSNLTKAAQADTGNIMKSFFIFLWCRDKTGDIKLSWTDRKYIFSAKFQPRITSCVSLILFCLEPIKYFNTDGPQMVRSYQCTIHTNQYFSFNILYETNWSIVHCGCFINIYINIYH